MFVIENSENVIKYHNTTFSNEIYTFKITVSAIYNKFDDVFGIVNDFLKENNELRILYDSTMNEYFSTKDIDDRYILLWEKMQHLIPMIDKMFYEKEITKNLNIKEKEEYKLNITLKEAKMLYKASIRTRFFVPFYLSDNAISEVQQKNLHNEICNEILEHGVVNKLFKIIDSMILKTSPERKGKKLWDLLSISQGYSSDSHNMELISSIFYKALPSLRIPQENDKNSQPIAYLISVAKNELQWLLQTSFPYVCIPSTIDLFSASIPKSNILEHEVFYRTIVKNIFADIAERYKSYSEIYRSNAYTVLYHISQPFVIKVFDLPVKYLNIPNIHLINLFVYDSLMQADPNKKILTNILKSSVQFDSSKIKPEYSDLPANLKEYLNNKIVGSNISTYIPDKTQNMIKRLFLNSVFSLYRNRYYDVKRKEYIEINWKNFIDEYVEYIYNLVVGKYDFIIQKKKEEIRQFV